MILVKNRSTNSGQRENITLVGKNACIFNVRFTLAYTILGEDFMFCPHKFPAQPENSAFAEQFWAPAEKLLTDGKIKMHPYVVGKDGLKGVIDGLDLLRRQQVSGQKPVYNVAETP